MTREEIKQVLDLATEYYKLEIFGTKKVSQSPAEERIDWILARLKMEEAKGLDEAAEEYALVQIGYADKEMAESSYAKHNKLKVNYFSGYDLSEAFNAGAEWMAKQGEFYEGKIQVSMRTGDLVAIATVPDEKYKLSDKVIVQIRKAE